MRKSPDLNNLKTLNSLTALIAPKELPEPPASTATISTSDKITITVSKILNASYTNVFMPSPIILIIHSSVKIIVKTIFICDIN